MIVFKIIKAAVSLLLFLLNPMTWFHWSKSKERLHNEFYWIWLKYHCFVLHKLSYPKIIRRISEKRRRGEMVHVGFIVFDTSKWNVDSVYREFNNLPGYDTTIFVFPDPQFPGGKDASVKFSAEFFQNKGYRVEYGYDPEKQIYKSGTIWKDYDIVFFDNPWLESVPVLQIEFIGKYALTCYIPYGFMAAGAISQTDYNMPYHSFAWKIFPEVSWHKEQFRKFNSATGDMNVVPLGYPKLDVFSEYVSNPESVWKSGLNPDIKRIIWTPHWTIYNNTQPGQFSTFHLIYNQMLSFAKEHKEIDWLFKPHPVLRSVIIKQELMTPQQADDYYQQWAEMSNGQVCLDGQFWDYFRTSDGMITDSIAFLIEYLPSQKPIFRIDSGHGIYNDFTKEIIANYYTGKTFEKIVDFLENVIVSNNDYLRDRRLNQLQKLDNLGCSGFAIVQYINNQFS